MVYRFFLLVLVFALAATLTFAVGQKDKASPTAAPGEPQYGGTLTWGHLWVSEVKKPVSFNPGGFTSRTWNYPYAEAIVQGDIDKFGPRGTNEYLFLQNSTLPDAFHMGTVVESWEISADEWVWHIRPGVMFTGNPNIGMEPREVTADDVVNALEMLRAPESPYRAFGVWMDTITATDSTVVIKTNAYNAQSIYTFGHALVIFPPELYEKEGDAYDWRNMVGTGPFILTDYVAGSQFTYERNPNYWGTTTIDGKEYQLPFVDKLIYPLIAEESSQIAALRTGKLDYLATVSPAFTKTLDATSPDLLKIAHNSDESIKLSFKTNEPPFNDINVRRAMWRGTDLEAINDGVYFGQGVIHNDPVNPNTTGVYIPQEELRPAGRELYDYNPELARQMLADAGYPDGFKVELWHRTDKDEHNDILALLIEQWDKIGVEINPVPMEFTALIPYWFGRDGNDYNGTVLYQFGNDPPFSVMSGAASPPGTGVNFSRYTEDEYYNKAYLHALTTPMSTAELTSELRELTQYFHEQALILNFTQPPKWSYWWPWLKNYDGELNAGVRNHAPINARVWIDQDMKADMR